MKTKLIALAIAAGVTLGTAGVASTASAAPAPLVPAASISIHLGGIFGGIRFGGYHHGYRHRRICRRLYILGFRYGNPRARYLWYRHCRRGFYPYY
jgi:hypothetical protein